MSRGESERIFREHLIDRVIGNLEVLQQQGHLPIASFDKLVYQYQAEKLNMPNKVSAATEAATLRRPSAAGTSPTRTVVAIDDYRSDVDGDLTFRQGEQIEILEDVDENWYRGRLGRREGIFPKSYVKRR
ncbi:hypothetical protein HDU97_003779 [Phlyctochytrium planicorne]|nr:hypothetical protein HDU97_003779 [Phlyctochytrium planicorne]